MQAMKMNIFLPNCLWKAPTYLNFWRTVAFLSTSSANLLNPHSPLLKMKQCALWVKSYACLLNFQNQSYSCVFLTPILGYTTQNKWKAIWLEQLLKAFLWESQWAFYRSFAYTLTNCRVALECFSPWFYSLWFPALQVQPNDYTYMVIIHLPESKF